MVFLIIIASYDVVISFDEEIVILVKAQSSFGH